MYRHMSLSHVRTLPPHTRFKQIKIAPLHLPSDSFSPAQIEHHSDLSGTVLGHPPIEFEMPIAAATHLKTSVADGLSERQLSTFFPTPTMARIGAGKFTVVVPKLRSKSVKLCLMRVEARLAKKTQFLPMKGTISLALILS